MEYVDDLLREMEMFAREHGTPILTEAARPLFLQIVREAAPRRILELGTAIGYSALLALRELPDAEIVTIERDAVIAEAARSFFSRAGVAGRTALLVGEAEKLLPTLSGTFDFVFIDAAKSRYPDFWLGVQPLLAPRAVVAADNVLFRGYVRGKGPIPHRFRTIAMRLREYLTLTSTTPGCSTEIVKCGDGLAVTTVRKDEGFAAKQA